MPIDTLMIMTTIIIIILIVAKAEMNHVIYCS